MLNKSQAKSVADSLDADPELLVFLPELLADLDALGSPVAPIEALVRQHLGRLQDLEMLDLGCGKGACLIQLAKTFGWQGVGVDLFPPFIEAARLAARRAGVDHYLRFEATDMVTWAESGHPVDLLIYGYDGDAFGDLNATLHTITRNLKPGGHLVLETVWQKNAQSETPHAATIAQLETAIEQAALMRIEETILDPHEVQRTNAKNTASIRRRAEALSQKHPEKAPQFRNYVMAQEAESEILDHELISGILLLQKRS